MSCSHLIALAGCTGLAYALGLAAAARGRAVPGLTHHRQTLGDRYRQSGTEGMADRSSRPHHGPARLRERTERRIIGLRVTARLGPARIASRLGLHASTVHRVLTRYHCPPLAHLDRATGRPIRRTDNHTVRRYEHLAPGDLVHVDIKKLGNIPDGGGWRTVGKRQGDRNARATTPRTDATGAP